MIRRRALLAAPALLALARPAYAAWPERPVRLIVPFAPGGPTDTVARWLARDLPGALGGGSFVVENRPGAGGNIGVAAAARERPDGHALLVIPNALVINPALIPSGVDVLRDFAPVCRAVTSPNLLVAHPSRGWRNLAELQAAARGAGDLTYSSPGIGTSPHLTGELLRQRVGLPLLHVPFPGAAPAAQALLGRQVDLASVALPQAMPSVAAGAFTPIALSGDARWPGLDVPTLREAGADVVVDTFQAVLAPAGTPSEIIGRLRDAVAAVMSPRRDELLRAGYAVVADTPEVFRAHIAEQLPFWADVVRRGGIKPD